MEFRQTRRENRPPEQPVSEENILEPSADQVDEQQLPISATTESAPKQLEKDPVQEYYQQALKNVAARYDGVVRLSGGEKSLLRDYIRQVYAVIDGVDVTIADVVDNFMEGFSIAHPTETGESPEIADTNAFIDRYGYEAVIEAMLILTQTKKTNGQHDLMNVRMPLDLYQAHMRKRANFELSADAKRDAWNRIELLIQSYHITPRELNRQIQLSPMLHYHQWKYARVKERERRAAAQNRENET